MIAVEDVENEARHSRKECSRAGGAPTLVPALTVISRGHMHYPALSRYRLRGIGGPRKHPSFSPAVKIFAVLRGRGRKGNQNNSSST